MTVVNLSVPVYPLDIRAYTEYLDFLKESRPFFVGEAVTRMLSEKVREINAKYLLDGPNMFTLDQAFSIRENYIKHIALHESWRISKAAAAIRKQVKSKTIEQLAKQYDYPPSSLLAFVVTPPPGYKINDVLLNPDIVPAFTDIIKRAESVDANSAIINRQIAIDAQKYEDDFVKQFYKWGVEFKTQNELVADQTKLYGRAIITPDLLITGNLTINGLPVKWIDCKMMFFPINTFLEKKIRAQAAKYVKEFGPGAMVFAWGFPYGVTIPDCLVLDGRGFSRAVTK